MVACNQTTEIIDVDNNQGIDDNKSNVHVTEIIDVEFENIDVETESINVGEYNNTIYAEMVDRCPTFCTRGYWSHPSAWNPLQIML